MPNDSLGISFSPFSQNGPQSASGGGQGGQAASTPQDAIRIMSFRPPRTVGANSPIPGPLMNAPGGASFGAAGGNLEQLLALLFGRGKTGLMGGVSGLPEAPQPMGGESPFGGSPFGGSPSPLPWEDTTPGKPIPRVRPGADEFPNAAAPLPGGTAGPGPALPWDGPNANAAPNRGGRFV